MLSLPLLRVEFSLMEEIQETNATCAPFCATLCGRSLNRIPLNIFYRTDNTRAAHKTLLSLVFLFSSLSLSISLSLVRIKNLFCFLLHHRTNSGFLLPLLLGRFYTFTSKNETCSFIYVAWSCGSWHQVLNFYSSRTSRIATSWCYIFNLVTILMLN